MPCVVFMGVGEREGGGMGSVGGEELRNWEVEGGGNDGGGGEERIVVSVRIRPLNGIEIARNDPSDWECINKNTIIFRNGVAEHSMYPHAYSFDRVFGCESSTRQVYEAAAKEIVMSVVNGINSSIFAYGQTSSGKTFTMSGITEFSVADIYDYIEKHKERDFVLKFSAIEIYNEAVRDLLSSDPTPLRLLDDPEKGTVIERLSEERLRDESHLWELLSLCEAQRQIGETSLNEMSSRSHQILKLTIESSSKENFNNLAASVNFVDLAGSERASQSLFGGTRLKEGCHINRSLLTLGTVIRKLSKGRSAHIPYRDSKLTRILQHSLGGNARTAIICTMSPARSHIEQSRNTLLFATCAKEVTTSAQVNVIMSDKALVKHLQKELSRLENELRRPVSDSNSGYSEALREKDFKIKKMEREIKELMQQRDLAQSRLEDLLRVLGEDQNSKDWDECSHVSSSNVPNHCEDVMSVTESSFTPYRIQEFPLPMHSSTPDAIRDDLDLHSHLPCIQKEEKITNYVKSTLEEKITNHEMDLEDHCKEVRCIEMDNSNKNKTDTNGKNFLLPLSFDPRDGVEHVTEEQENEVRIFSEDNELPNTSRVLHGNLICVRGRSDDEDIGLTRTISEMKPETEQVMNLVGSWTKEKTPSYFGDLVDPRRFLVSRSRSCRASLMTSSPSSFSFQRVEENDRTPSSLYLKDFHGRPERFQIKFSEPENNTELLEKPLEKEIQRYEQCFTNDVNMSENCVVEDSNFVNGVKETDQIEYEQENHHNFSDFQDLERTISEDYEVHKSVKDVGVDPVQTSMEEFKKKQKEIIELWDACSVSLVHRTCFFLLFKGDPNDSIYLEVELRRLSFLIRTLSSGVFNGIHSGDSPISAVDSSLKNLRHEREMLCRQMKKKMSEEERKKLYARWGISPNSKQRRLQLAKLLWSEPHDTEHVHKSAAIVAKLVGISEPKLAAKEMFGINFNIPCLLGKNRGSIFK